MAQLVQQQPMDSLRQQAPQRQAVRQTVLCYIDADGHSCKPVLLPQKDPAFYDSLLKTYNAPELVTGRVELGEDQLRAVVVSSPAGQDVSAITGATP